MDSVTIGVRKNKVLVLNNTSKFSILMGWELAQDFGKNLNYLSRKNISGSHTIGNSIVISEKENEIIILILGKVFLVLPFNVALQLGNDIIGKSKKLEEIAKAEQIAFDNAILQRRGINLGLSDNKDIQELTGKEAAWNSSLRRYIPNTNLRQQAVGTPTVKRENNNGRK